MEPELEVRPVPSEQDAEGTVTALYAAHALELVRLALVMVGERETAEDVVQDAFIGLYRRWDGLRERGKALTYLRSSVLNGCRSALRRRRFTPWTDRPPAVPSAEHEFLGREDHREVLRALRRLPHRQRETLVLRYVFDLSEEEIAETMGVTRGTVKSNAAKGRANLGRLFGEEDG
ncbi:SigE family RNA polymerase sigma factor [Actinomadura fibrosa]|uniref:SigE family RNA polymerase sigma factor n=1 Tax=Actinomadura fibrosa TaxID=111802 RepID=A0ABW2XJI7_9ACTN|nr:SigE family RNA polymerase sigma factor [Actinomadura fibrosa]